MSFPLFYLMTTRLQIIFVFGDHIRKGAAPNVVQIAKMLLEANMFCLTSQPFGEYQGMLNFKEIEQLGSTLSLLGKEGPKKVKEIA
ncbi:hypothetical protein L1887_34321 [Cichorium endivia]|nr:hypothetical protein L1887_34321 [Cichorium endivia]